MDRSLIDQRIRKSMSSAEIEDKLLSSEDFLLIFNSLTLYVNDSKRIVICDNNYEEIPEEKLLKIFSNMNFILGTRFNFMENLSTLKELLFRNLDDLDIQKITDRKKELDQLKDDPENKEFKVKKVIKDLEETNPEYITYDQIIRALKDTFNLTISVKNNSISKYLKESGYQNKRLTIEGKKIRVWVKTN